MQNAKGLGGAFALFLIAFLLHIAGGKLDWRWLFIAAVCLIVTFAAAYPTVAALIARSTERPLLITGAVVGVVLTGGVLWAFNDRAMAGWIYVAAPAGVLMLNLALLMIGRSLSHFRSRVTVESPVPTRRGARS